MFLCRFVSITAAVCGYDNDDDNDEADDSVENDNDVNDGKPDDFHDDMMIMTATMRMMMPLTMPLFWFSISTRKGIRFKIFIIVPNIRHLPPQERTITLKPRPV